MRLPYRRQAYAGAVYMKTRASEQEAISVADVDLVHTDHQRGLEADGPGRARGARATKRTKTAQGPHDRHRAERARARGVAREAPAREGGPTAPDAAPRGPRRATAEGPPGTVGVTGARSSTTSNELQREIVVPRPPGIPDSRIWRSAGTTRRSIQWTGGHTDLQTTQGYIDRGQWSRRQPHRSNPSSRCSHRAAHSRRPRSVSPQRVWTWVRPGTNWSL